MGKFIFPKRCQLARVLHLFLCSEPKSIGFAPLRRREQSTENSRGAREERNDVLATRDLRILLRNVLWLQSWPFDSTFHAGGIVLQSLPRLRTAFPILTGENATTASLGSRQTTFGRACIDIRRIRALRAHRLHPHKGGRVTGRVSIPPRVVGA